MPAITQAIPFQFTSEQIKSLFLNEDLILINGQEINISTRPDLIILYLNTIINYPEDKLNEWYNQLSIYKPQNIEDLEDIPYILRVNVYIYSIIKEKEEDKGYLDALFDYYSFKGTPNFSQTFFLFMNF